MTQIAGLGASTAPTKTVKGAAADEMKALAEQFAGLLTQNTQDLADTASGYEDLAATETMRLLENGADKNERDYAKLSGSTRREIAKTEQPKKEVTEQLAQGVEKVAEAAEEVLEENFDISEEDLEQLMAELGLTAADLLQPQKLTVLVQNLTGADDAASLLISADFQTTLEQVNGLIEAFCAENGLTQEQFTDLLAEFSEVLDQMIEEVKELLGEAPAEQTEVPLMQEGAQTDGAEQAVTAISQEPETETRTERTVQTAAQDAAEPVREAPVREAVSETEQTAEPAERPAEQAADAADGQDADGAWKDSLGENDTQGSLTEEHTTSDTQTEHMEAFANTHVTNAQAADPTGEMPAPTQNYLELEHLMDQLEGLARTYASAAGTTVEMQLNPENLGKLVLTVTEKHGSVTAQIETTNEQVKESLQAQLIELRSTLMAQGVRVDAVEVTVATHEFEQNLDQNAAASGQTAEQEQQERSANGRRNLDSRSLDELSGLMSEEEALVARMMRDNGGTVDYTA